MLRVELFCKTLDRFFVMTQLSKDQRIWICLEFARSNNASEVIRRWINHWLSMRPPTVWTVTKSYQQFLNEGTCLDVNKGRSGRD